MEAGRSFIGNFDHIVNFSGRSRLKSFILKSEKPMGEYKILYLNNLKAKKIDM